MHLALELGLNSWKLGFTTGLGQATRLRQVAGQDREALRREIAKAKEKFGLLADAPVRCCYEAGRDGFWLHRWLVSEGIDNLIVDSSSIEVNRRKRRAKSDALDADQLARMLVRYHQGDRKIWRVVRVPSEADEDRRQLHRELETLKDQRTEHINRIKGGQYRSVDDELQAFEAVDLLQVCEVLDRNPLLQPAIFALGPMQTLRNTFQK